MCQLAILTMRNLLLSIFCIFIFAPVFTQVTVGIETGLDQHIAGGGPYLGVTTQYKNFRFGLQMLTQVNALTPYKFERYGDYKFASNAQQFLGGGMSLGYEFMMDASKRVRPILFYRAGYFNTGYSRIQYLDCTTGNEDFTHLRLKSPQSFSTTQSMAAGITVDLIKGLRMDFTAGSGVYIFRDFNAWTFTNDGYNVSGVTEVRPDFNLNLSISYHFHLK